MHPFAQEREYTRALNATKLGKLFAKPFVAALSGHLDGIYCLRRHVTFLGISLLDFFLFVCFFLSFLFFFQPDEVNLVLSGDFAGEIRLWNVAQRKSLYRLHAHNSCVRGVCVTPTNDAFLSCSDDKTIKLWRLSSNEHQFVSTSSDQHHYDEYRDDEDADDVNDDDDAADDGGAGKRRKRAGTSMRNAASLADIDEERGYVREATASDIVTSWSGTSAFTDVDHQRSSEIFVTSGTVVNVWDRNRSAPLHTFEWGHDSHTSTKFNPVERSLFATLAADRSIILYDTRAASPLRKCILPMRSNALAWNPMEAFNFTVANEDYNLYSFDMRQLDKARTIHRGHVRAVLSLDYSPTGREIVSGSFDRTIRVFGYDRPRSRAVYHTSRMQRVFAVQFTGDAQYVLTGSEDANLRVWKSDASAPLRVVGGRERRAMSYRNSLRRRFAHMPEIRKIERFQHLPKSITIPAKEEVIVRAAAKRKLENRLAHSHPVREETKRGKKLTVRQKAVNAVQE